MGLMLVLASYTGSKATATITCIDYDVHDNKYTNAFSGDHGVFNGICRAVGRS